MLTSLSLDVSLLSVCGRHEVWIAGFHSPSILHRLALDWKQYLVNAKNCSDAYESQSLNFRHFIFNQVAQMCFAALKLQLLQKKKNNAELTFSSDWAIKHNKVSVTDLLQRALAQDLVWRSQFFSSEMVVRLIVPLAIEPSQPICH